MELVVGPRKGKRKRSVKGNYKKKKYLYTITLIYDEQG
jgi:hypothetical protein